ncbi:hypothetical protein HAX54_031956 [Datura stramonium]|uniref:Uncharacterized protein n=1 Tax=Datura stramonium TaxID=4076 RepID=A0ABS8VB93_DATST|nr:hypothetical protein [Datura stramonium]
MHSSDEGPLMTHEYSDWWPTHRRSMLRRSTHIILRVPRNDDAPSSTKDGQPQLNGQGKLSHCSKPKVTPSNPMQTIKVGSNSKILKGKDTQDDKEVNHSSLAPKAATTTASEAIDIAHKRKRPSSSSGNCAEKSLGVVPFCSGTSKPPISLNGDGITSAASSSNESNRL